MNFSDFTEHRYIELFLNSTPAGRSDGGMSGSGGGSGFGGGNMNDNFDNFSGNDSGMMGMGKSQMNMMGQGM